MKTPQLMISKGQDSTSMLFRQLFLMNLQLENYQENQLGFTAEVDDVTRSIERLMEVILQHES